jgi:chromosome segregation ATPase
MSDGIQGEGGSNHLEQIIEKLEHAEERLLRLRGEEAEVEREIHQTLEELKAFEHHVVEVHVVHVNEVEKTSFKANVSATLQKVWDKAYRKLEIPHAPKDVFQTGGEHPKSLMTHLALSLKEAKDQGVIENHHFGIASETGGA